MSAEEITETAVGHWRPVNPRSDGATMRLDHIDHSILRMLSQNSRISIRTLAEKIHLSRAAAYRRIAHLESTGVLTGYTVAVDRAALGASVSAVVIVKCNTEHWRDIADALSSIPEVATVRAVSGDIEFVLTVYASDQASLSDVVMREISRIPGVTDTSTHVVLHEHANAGLHPQERHTLV